MAHQYSILRRRYQLHLSHMAIVETTPPEPSVIKLDYENQNDRARLLHGFLLVRDLGSLLKYFRSFGLPDRREENTFPELTVRSFKTNEPIIRLIHTESFLRSAAMLRWLLTVMDAVDRYDHQQLELLVMGKAGLQEFQLINPPKRAKRVIRLTMEPPSNSKEYKDFALAQTMVATDFDLEIRQAEWSGKQKKQRLDFAKKYVAHHINQQLQGVHPAVYFNGKIYFAVTQPIEAMYLELYHRFTGSSGIGICKNPNCPKRFFVIKRKGSRKPRSDRKYCGRPGCQKWCRVNLGRVRPSKSGSN